MNNEIMPFDFRGNQVRVVMIDGQPWWVVNDVCAVLGISDGRQAADRLPEEDRCQTPVLDSRGVSQQSWVANESGLYELIFRSDKPAARDFRRWVTAEVLPQIRKTGGYALKAMSPAELLVHQAQQLLAQERRVLAIEQRMDSIEQKTDWFTALGYAKRQGLRTNHDYVWRLGMAAGRISRAAGEEPAKVYNELWGEVNSYPEWALSEAAGGLA